MTSLSAAAKPGPRGFRALIELFKLRMTAHILTTTVAGFYMASSIYFQWGLLGWTVLGTGLLAVSAFCFNQSMEVDFDRVMERTQKRPLPSDRLGVKAGYAAGVVTCLLGGAILYAEVNTLTALLGIPVRTRRT